MDWISAASSTHAPSPTEVGSRSGQPRYRQRDVLTAPSPSASRSRFGVPPPCHSCWRTVPPGRWGGPHAPTQQEVCLHQVRWKPDSWGRGNKCHRCQPTVPGGLMSCSSLLKIHWRPSCRRPYARAEEGYRCWNHLDMVWGGSLCLSHRWCGLEPSLGWRHLRAHMGLWHHHPASNPTEFGRRAFRWCWARACTCKAHHPRLLNGLLNSPSPHSARLQRTWV